MSSFSSLALDRLLERGDCKNKFSDTSTYCHNHVQKAKSFPKPVSFARSNQNMVNSSPTTETETETMEHLDTPATLQHLVGARAPEWWGPQALKGSCMGSSNGDVDNREGSSSTRPLLDTAAALEHLTGFYGAQSVLTVSSNTVETKYENCGCDDDEREDMSCISKPDSEDACRTEVWVNNSAATLSTEFFDAWEELSCSSRKQQSVAGVESELREIRLALLMEIERRKQAEEAMSHMRQQWQQVRQKLAYLGLTFPECPAAVLEDDQPSDVLPAENLCRQIRLSRVVSFLVGRAFAKSEMEPMVDAKNAEVVRLMDCLHYYESVNEEMSPWSHQQALLEVQRNGQVRKEGKRWIWRSVAALITIGAAALTRYYIPGTGGSSAAADSLAAEQSETHNG